MGFQVGQRVADYEIESLLGVGGMGRVYRVRNVISHRIEAMKVLLADLSEEPALAARFLGEIRTLAALDHPHIAQLHTALQTGNELVMVMEFVEGSTLQELAQQNAIPVPLVVNYMHQVLAALGYAHQHGVVHRDIKPANIMVTSHGSVKLTDFGIAKSKSKDELTRPGTTVGSLNYMSPEQALGGSTADGRSDLYSVGISLYELLAGRRPFEDESAYVILHSQLNVKPQPPIELNPALSQAVSDLIMKALEKEPDRRFQSAAEFSEALHEATGIAPDSRLATAVHAVPDAVSDVLSWFSSGEHRRLWFATEVAATLLVVASAALGVPRLLKHTGSVQPAMAAIQKPVVSTTPQASGFTAVLPSAPAIPPAVAVTTPPTATVTASTVTAATVTAATVTAATVTAATVTAPLTDAGQRREPEAPRLKPVAERTPLPLQAQATGEEPDLEATARPALTPAALAEVEEIRRQRTALDARASVLRASVRRLRTVEAAQGDVLNDAVAGAYVDMNMNLSAGKTDLDDGNVAAARGHMEKAADQVAVLEKLLSDQKE